MRRIQRSAGLCRKAVTAGIAVGLAFSSQCHGAWSGMYACYGPRCITSPLDMPLTPYAMPRRPAWGGSSYRYSLKPTPQCQICGCGLANDDASVDCQTPYPPGAAASFEPATFERLGQIPHEPLLGPGPAVGPGLR
jgi:hypothetical protein